MTLFFYNLFFTVFLIGYVLYTLVRIPFRKGLGKLLLQRTGWIPFRSNRRPIWIHAASVGEVMCTLPLFNRLRREAPGVPIVITTMTRTGNKTAETLLPGAEGVFFFPFDHPLMIRRAIRKIHPRLLLIAETELWPNLLRSCEAFGIPVLLFNGRISRKSVRGYLALPSLFKKPLQSLSLLLMQTEEDRSRIIEIGALPDRTRVTGNLKFDQSLPAWTPEERETLAASLGLHGRETLFIAGSTHSGEEEILIDHFKKLQAETPELMLLLAPRHLDRLEEVEKILKQEGLFWMRRTSLTERKKTSTQDPSGFPSVILLDTMGELMKLYRLGTIVFIGGSLVPVGGHNPLEPLIFKRCVLFGPYMFHFSEISNRLIEQGGAIGVRGKEDLLETLKRLVKDPKAREETGERGYQFLQRHRGAAEKMMEEIRPYLHRNEIQTDPLL